MSEKEEVLPLYTPAAVSSEELEELRTIKKKYTKLSKAVKIIAVLAFTGLAVTGLTHAYDAYEGRELSHPPFGDMMHHDDGIMLFEDPKFEHDFRDDDDDDHHMRGKGPHHFRGDDEDHHFRGKGPHHLKGKAHHRGSFDGEHHKLTPKERKLLKLQKLEPCHKGKGKGKGRFERMKPFNGKGKHHEKLEGHRRHHDRPVVILNEETAVSEDIFVPSEEVAPIEEVASIVEVASTEEKTEVETTEAPAEESN